MKLEQLGKTELRVSKLGLGGLFARSSVNALELTRSTVNRALELGVNYLDTAPGYGDSEVMLGRALAGVKQPLVLSTKLGGRPQPFNPQDKKALRESVEQSLRNLNRETIDILMIHEPDRPGQYEWWTNWENFTGPVLEVLADLKRAGLIRYTGLGGTTAYEMARVARTGRFDVVLTAFNYSLLWREAVHDLLPSAKQLHMGIIAASPLQQGALARRHDEEVNRGAPWLSPPRRRQFQALYRFLDEVNLPISEAGIRFVLSNPDIHCVLMGAGSVEEVEANVAAVEKGPLAQDILKRLDEIAAMVPFRPCEEPFGLPFRSSAYKGPGRAGR